MHWNYRVIRSHCAGDYVYQIHEVYYSPDGAPGSWTENPIAPLGETPLELRSELEHMLRALDKPVLEVDRDRLVEVK